MSRPPSTHLSDAQRKLLRAVGRLETRGDPAFVMDVVKALRLRGESSVTRTLNRMERNGFITLKGGGRGRSRVVCLTSRGRVEATLGGVPLLGSIPFGFGIHYPVRNPDTGGHHYYLAHFCDHEDGYCYMANFMAEVERTLEGLSKRTGDLFTKQPMQMELLEIRKEFIAQAEDAAVKRIVSALPGILRDHKLQGRRVENRRIFAAIVDRFGYDTTRKEWVRALRELQQARKLTMEGTEDSSVTYIHTSSL